MNGKVLRQLCKECALPTLILACTLCVESATAHTPDDLSGAQLAVTSWAHAILVQDETALEGVLHPDMTTGDGYSKARYLKDTTSFLREMATSNVILEYASYLRNGDGIRVGPVVTMYPPSVEVRLAWFLDVIPTPDGWKIIGVERSDEIPQELLNIQRPEQLELRTMHISIRDGSSGDPVAASVRVVDSSGRYWAPQGHHVDVPVGWREDVGRDVVVAGKSYAYVEADFELPLVAGDYTLEVSKGMEYLPEKVAFSVADTGPTNTTVYIDRWIDMQSSGWYSADTHVHFVRPKNALLEARALGVNVVNILAAKWNNLVTDVGVFEGAPDQHSTEDTIVYVNEEARHGYLGHTTLLGLEELIYPLGWGDDLAAGVVRGLDYPPLAHHADSAHEQGGIVGWAHFPFPGGELAVDVGLGKVDSIDLLTSGDPRAGRRGSPSALDTWYRLLNCGFRLPATAGTDKMDNTRPIGTPRVFSHIEGPLSYDKWTDSIRAGRTFVTSGPMLTFSVDGQQAGSTIVARKGNPVRVEASVSWLQGAPALELLVNGEVVKTIKNKRGRDRIELTHKLTPDETSWIAVRAISDELVAGEPTEYGMPIMAHSSPIYISVDGTAQTSSADAQYFINWIDRSTEWLRETARFANEEQQRSMLQLFGRGRLVYERQLEAPNPKPGTVEIIRDDWGVPHVYAAAEDDAMFGVGYALAEDNLRGILRAYLGIQGRSAAAFGPEQVSSDESMRMWRVWSQGKLGYEKLPVAERAGIDAFMRGLRRFMHDNPDKVPDWAYLVDLHPAAPVAYGYSLALLLSVAQEREALSDCAAAGIEPPQPTIIASLRERHTGLPGGSNQWVVMPERTLAKAPILWADSHSSFAAQRDEIRVHAGDLQTAGIVVAGMTLPIIGHTRGVAWSLTVGGPDVSDCIEIEVDSENEQRYRYDGVWTSILQREETINVAGQAPHRFVVEYTNHNGVYSPIVMRVGDKAYAVSSGYSERPEALTRTTYQMNKANDIEAFDKALSIGGLFPDNVMAADTNGEAYYVLEGLTPRRPDGPDWAAPVSGNTSQVAWLGLHDHSDLVQTGSPPLGYMHNTNTASDTLGGGTRLDVAQYPAYLFNDKAGRRNERGRRAEELLSALKDASVEDMLAVGFDEKWINYGAWQDALSYSADAWGSASNESAVTRRVLEMLQTFDGAATADSRHAYVYLSWLNSLIELSATKPGSFRALATSVLSHVELDAKQKKLIADSIVQTSEQLSGIGDGKFGTLGDFVRVGRDDTTRPFGGIYVAHEGIVADVTLRGSACDWNATGCVLRSGQRHPFLTVLSTPIRSWSAVPYGQSSDRSSAHFSDQAELLSRKELKPTYFDWADLRGVVVSHLTLETAARGQLQGHWLQERYGKYWESTYEKYSARISADTTDVEHYGYPNVTTDSTDERKSGLEMVYVEGGEYVMGGTENVDDGGRPEQRIADECPHSVEVASFFIGKYEITQADWLAVMGNKPSSEECLDCPVNQVSWHDVQGFIRELNHKDDQRYRLPTEEEWEFAARGGVRSRNLTYAGSDDMNEVAWYSGNSNRKLHPVGMLRPNELGIFDMSGNIWEWLRNDKHPYSCDLLGKTFTSAVLRGGTFSNHASSVRVRDRNGRDKATRLPTLGFRLARQRFTQ